LEQKKRSGKMAAKNRDFARSKEKNDKSIGNKTSKLETVPLLERCVSDTHHYVLAATPVAACEIKILSFYEIKPVVYS
jgi:hypothetical protein